MIPRSLTVRLTLLFGVASTIVLAIIGYAFYVALGAHFLHEDAIEMRGKAELVGNLIGRVQSGTDLQTLPDKLRDALVGHDNLTLEVRTPEGRVIFTPREPAAASLNGGSPSESQHQLEGLTIDTIAVAGHRYRVTRFRLPTSMRELPELSAALVMNIDHHERFMAHIRNTVLISVLLGAAASGLLGWLSARLGIAPLRAFSSLTSRITASRLDDRVAIGDLPPELADLGQSFNAMLARLEDSFRRLKEFSSDLAHELRTPISVLLTQSQVALSRSRSADEYREVIYSAMEEYDRLARMITDMLFLAQADHGLLVPKREPVDIRAEVLALCDFYDALAESKDVRLAVSGDGTISGDRLMVRRALSNLLSNAIRHGDAGSTVSIDIVPHENDGISISVANEGSYIAPEHLPRLFDRFYRVDAARERSSDGAGLGLSITKSIVDAHGGTISVTSQPTRTRFELTLPAAA